MDRSWLRSLIISRKKRGWRGWYVKPYRGHFKWFPLCWRKFLYQGKDRIILRVVYLICIWEDTEQRQPWFCCPWSWPKGMLVGTSHQILEGREKTQSVGREDCDSRKGLKKNVRGHAKAVFKHQKDCSVEGRQQKDQSSWALGWCLWRQSDPIMWLV